MTNEMTMLYIDITKDTRKSKDNERQISNKTAYDTDRLEVTPSTAELILHTVLSHQYLYTWTGTKKFGTVPCMADSSSSACH